MSSALKFDSNLFGWDLTYASVKNDIKNNEDLLIVLVHWTLIKSHFRCVGIGESIEECDCNTPSEMLPSGWNFADNYALRYIYKEKLYNLSLIKNSDDVVIVNILHKGTKISSTDIDINKTIHCLFGSINEILPNYRDFFLKLESDLIMPITENTSLHQSTQTSSLCRDSQAFANPEQRNTPTLFHEPPLMIPNRIDPFADIRQVGRADLDPFGRGGGMLFNPHRSSDSFTGPSFPGVAPNSVPPGARFDPFRPPGADLPPGPRRNPDSDHFPPPGYDDMFM